MGAAVAYGNYDIAIVLSVANFAVLRWLAPFKANPGATADERPHPDNQS